jgi:hypothetical protein
LIDENFKKTDALTSVNFFAHKLYRNAIDFLGEVPGRLARISHHDSGRAGLKQAAEKLIGTVILRSRRRRRISHCLENTQSEILRCAQNDSIVGFFRSLL